uniref:Uncharacterized protein n=1 Tax=Emiliania huxleyi (strain CCMP1516) TaxID=280463 RepID=A0A0D3IMW9_EMIH1
MPARRSTGRSAPASPATPCQQPGARGRGAELARGGSWSPRSGRAGPPGRRGSSERRAEPARVHDRSTSRRRERRCVEVPRPAAAACRNG